MIPEISKNELLGKLGDMIKHVESCDDSCMFPDFDSLYLVENRSKQLSEGDVTGVSSYLTTLDVLSRTTDDYLFVYDIAKDNYRMFGTYECDFDLKNGAFSSITTDEILKITHPADRQNMLQNIEDVCSGREKFLDGNCRWVNRNGQNVWVSVRGRVILDANGVPKAIMGRVSSEALRHLYNPLTGLFNKIKMMPELKVEFESNSGTYLMIIDVDDLSAINLTHGRKYGDVILKTLAEKLESQQETKKIYHVDHNYFVVIVDKKDFDGVNDFYKKICDEMVEYCTLSAGVVPVCKDVFTDETNLYDSAKIVFKEAKANGKNSIKFFSLDEIRQKIHSVGLLEDLQDSVWNNFEGFELNYQPQVRSGSYELYSFEALLRYNLKDGTRVFPDQFIPLLEQSKLILPVGMWVLEQALIQCRKWRESLPKLRVSVNFSAVQFSDECIVDKILETINKTGVPGDALTIEITESVSVHETERFAKIIKRLKEEGIQIAVDDFGTGYSGLSYLKQLDIDEIKIDRMFVKDIEQGTYNYRLVSNTLEFAKMNSIRICCEGVENVRELTVLESMASDLMQGYLFDKPGDAQTIELSYINNDSDKYVERQNFIQDLYKYKEQNGFIRFDPKEILRETDVGLWIIRMNESNGYCELHVDETMERILGLDKKYTPAECYRFWFDRVKPECFNYIKENLTVMAAHNKPVQLQYSWMHPTLGEIVVRSTGRRVADADGMVVVEGYHRIFSNIEEV